MNLAKFHLGNLVLTTFLKSIFVFLFVLISSIAIADDTLEQEEQASFEITSLVIEGNTLLSTEKLQAVVQPFIIKKANINTLQSALKAVEKAYAATGYSAMQAVLPEQESDGGVFRIRVVEATLAKLEVVGNENFDHDNILNSAPGLVLGQSPNLLDVAKTLRIANESFAKRTKVVIGKSSNPNQIDAQLRVQDVKPWRFATSIDNTGTKPTGRQRVNLVFQHANFFNADHAFAGQFTTSPEHEGQVKIFGLSYRIPVYTFADTIDISAGHSDVDSGVIKTTAGDFGISGSGDYVSFNYNHALPVWHDIEQRLTLGLNWRSFETDVTLVGSNTSLIPDLTSAPASLTYRLNNTQGLKRWYGSVSWVHNLPSGNKGDDKAYNQLGARPGADARFNVYRYQLGYSMPVTQSLSMNLALNGQYTNDLLISGEQFGVGGAGSVRGFDMREVNGDKGYRAGVELTTKPYSIAKKGNVYLAGALFYDHGYAQRNDPLPGEDSEETIAGFGAGIRMTIGSSFQMKLDLAKAVNGSPTYDAGEYQGHAEMVYIF